MPIILCIACCARSRVADAHNMTQVLKILHLCMLYEENKYKIMGANPGIVKKKRAFSRPKCFRVRSGGIYRAETGSVPYSTGGKKKEVRGRGKEHWSYTSWTLSVQSSSVSGPTHSPRCRSCSAPEPSVRPQGVRPLLPTQSTTAHERPAPRARLGHIFGIAAAREIERGRVSRTSAFSDCRDDRPSMGIVRMSNRSNAGGTTACADSALACGRTLHCI